MATFNNRIRSIGWLHCADGSINLTSCLDGKMFPTVVNVTAIEFSLVREDEEKMVELAAKKLSLSSRK